MLNSVIYYYSSQFHITMGYACCVTGCTSNYYKDNPNVTVFKFPTSEELRQKWLLNIPRKFDKITQSTRVCVKHFEDKDVHSFNIHTNPDGTTYRVSNLLYKFVSSIISILIVYMTVY